MYHRNQPDKSKLALYNQLLSHCLFKTAVALSNKMERFSYKGRCGMTNIGMFEEELV